MRFNCVLVWIWDAKYRSGDRGSNKELVQKGCGSILFADIKPSVSSHNNDLLSLHYPFFTLLHFVTRIETLVNFG